MEMVYYKCPKCGFVYQVPAYWSDFSPEEQVEFLHCDLETKEMCSEMMLTLIKA